MPGIASKMTAAGHARPASSTALRNHEHRPNIMRPWEDARNENGREGVGGGNLIADDFEVKIARKTDPTGMLIACRYMNILDVNNGQENFFAADRAWISEMPFRIKDCDVLNHKRIPKQKTTIGCSRRPKFFTNLSNPRTCVTPLLFTGDGAVIHSQVLI
ncbi:MAG TPA: hypothetical protein VKU82_10090 [Planctomycetaceae bacterium]|nr:hypothetical protein [Planctomycetaceae bacterium]